ncbi:alpha/beta hydrolase [Cellulomonas edaphi]|uniref:Alpha/beta hydrolase n=1 Tax=Cellulomonas edaphi TaxID=3053468 RepID=A0ABT7S7Q2_9CELL|nr:alpha/beta hydrolase [Cellulomons edaphi]MDM7831642.1 alpha/beta hydrolase [Cellulomons edaphi]
MTQQQRDALDAALRANPFDTSQTAAEHRRDFAQAFTVPYAPGVITRQGILGGVATLRLEQAGATGDGVLLYFHGGGYVVGSARTHAHLAAELARRIGVSAASVDYRLAPEHPFPAPVQDALAAYRGLLDDGTPPSAVVLAGDSAGGGVVAALLLAARDAGLPVPAGAAVFSPWVDLTLTSGTIESKAGRDPLFDRRALEWYTERYLAGADPAQPWASPALADLAGLPPLLVQVGSRELLVGDALRLAAAAAEADVDVTLEVVAGVPHVFHNAFGVLDDADAALARAAAFLRARLADAVTAHTAQS